MTYIKALKSFNVTLQLSTCYWYPECIVRWGWVFRTCRFCFHPHGPRDMTSEKLPMGPDVLWRSQQTLALMGPRNNVTGLVWGHSCRTLVSQTLLHNLVQMWSTTEEEETKWKCFLLEVNFPSSYTVNTGMPDSQCTRI